MEWFGNGPQTAYMNLQLILIFVAQGRHVSVFREDSAG
jgi:hypothetical protein